MSVDIEHNIHLYLFPGNSPQLYGLRQRHPLGHLGEYIRAHLV